MVSRPPAAAEPAAVETSRAFAKIAIKDFGGFLGSRHARTEVRRHSKLLLRPLICCLGFQGSVGLGFIFWHGLGGG